jgi:AcrR family transcriptional regulator
MALADEVPSDGRRATKRRRTRIALRSAAYDLMSAQGVDATTIAQITERAEVGFGTFYNYYPSKDALAEAVLDCVIHAIGLRNDAVTAELGETDPVAIVANSVRFVVREMTSGPMWRWWFARLDLLVERTRVGFAPFGLRDIEAAVDSGDYHLAASPAAAWSQLVWLMAAAAKDILDGHLAPHDERALVEGGLRVMGVDRAHAFRVTRRDLLPSPDVPIDFSFEITANDDET